MPNNPYAPAPLNPPPDQEAWRSYERANRRAANEYPRRLAMAALPPCPGCRRPVGVKGRMCIKCRALGL